MKKLTKKQERFCLEYIIELNAAAAYRSAYNVSNMTDQSIYVEASRLLNHPKISLRISRLTSKIREKSENNLRKSLDEKLADCQKGMEGAYKSRLWSAYAANLRLSCELLGFIGRKVEVVQSIEHMSLDEVKAARKRVEQQLRELEGPEVE